MHSHDRLLRILELFTLEKPEWSFDEMHAHLGYSRSTSYRYLKSLVDAGLLASLPGRGYTLGPRIIELDFQIMETDPLIRAAQPAMEALAVSFGGTSLLCRLYRDRVLCVSQYSDAPRPLSGYRRGSARPLLRGAASLVILAHLSSYQLGKLFRKMPQDFAAAGLGESLADVRERLKAIRQAGWLHTVGEVTPGVTGVAAPVLGPGGEAIGSFSITLPQDPVDPERLAAIGEAVARHAAALSRSLG